MNALTKMDFTFGGPLGEPYWIIKEYSCANIPCAIFNADLITENPFASVHKRGDRHDQIDNVAVSPKDFDAVEHLLEPEARRRFHAREDALVTIDTARFDLDSYRRDWVHRLVCQRRAVLLKQARDWFHITFDERPNNLCGPLQIMAREHKIVNALTKQVSRIQKDHEARLLILSPAPIKYVPLLRLRSKTMDHLVFHPPIPGGAT